jgi:hypothetical protein
MIPQNDCMEIQNYIRDFSAKYKSHNKLCIDKIYLYLVSEGNLFTANYFIDINERLYNNEVRYKNLELYNCFVNNLIRRLIDLKCRSATEDFHMPTEIKIIYNCIADSCETEVSYEKHFRVRKPTIGPYEVFNKWFEDTKREFEENKCNRE